jgi:4-hydroxybenzoate polyprenyltransferase
MTSLKNWNSLVKLSHTLFSLPFALIGYALGYVSHPENSSLRNLLLMLLSVFFARNAAMAFNRITDRGIDAKNDRTKLREIPARKISTEKAMVFVLINILLFILSAYLINPLAFYLSPLAILIILGYSFTKRFTWLCHYVLGLALAIAPIGAYIVLSGTFGVPPLLLSVAVFFWVGGFDILYSLQDEEFDRQEKLHSIPQQFGRKTALIISATSHLFTLASLAVFGIIMVSTWIYWIGFSLFSALLTREHLIVKPGDISRVNQAFATLNATASIIFAVFSLLDLFSFYSLP